MSDHENPPPDLPDAPADDENGTRPGTGAPQGRTEPARNDDAGRTPDNTADNLPDDEYEDAGATDAPES